MSDWLFKLIIDILSIAGIVTLMVLCWVLIWKLMGF